LLSLGRYLAAAGEEQRLTALLTPEVGSMPKGARARAHLLLTDGAVSHIDECMRHLEHALDDAGDNRELRARALARKALYMAICYIERLAEADAWAHQAVADAPALHPGAELEALHAFAWTSILRGRGVDDLRERSRALSDDAVHGLGSIDRVAAVRLAWRGRVDEARDLFQQLGATADERGEASSYVVMRQHLCELALRAGAWDEAARLLDEWRESADGELLLAPSYQRCLALLAAGRGIPDEIESLTAQVRAGADASGLRWSLLETLRAHGIAALLAHKPSLAAESLRSVWSHTEREGVEDPGAFSSAPDLVEALVELGELDEARAVSDRLRSLADEQEHPWGRATAKRCDALVRLACGTDEALAREELEHAAATYAELGLRFDHGRTLLLLGRAQRRRRKWALARDALERAVTAFEEIGSPGWVDETRSELDRVGARRPQPGGGLSPSEQRVAELAAEGLSNKQIAQALFVTAKTVEAHLSHAYAKLGVRSRSQLAARLSSLG
jgi:DNA-binding CsgD family transcriptional regulator